MYRENPKGSKKHNPLAFINKFIKFVGKNISIKIIFI